MIKRILFILVLCLMIISPVLGAYDAPIDMGDLYFNESVNLYGYDGDGTNDSVDVNCAREYPTKPYGGRGQLFLSTSNTGWTETQSAQAILNPPLVGASPMYVTYKNNETVTKSAKIVYGKRVCSAAPRDSNNYAVAAYTWYYNLSSSLPPVPTASFSCVPLSQFPSSDVVCSDSSTGVGISSWFWQLGIDNLNVPSYITTTNRNFTWSSLYASPYTVSLKATNDGGSDWENKTGYVTISPNATPNATPSHEETNILMTVRNGLNSTPVPNVYTELVYTDDFGEHIVGTYTDANGQVTYGSYEILPMVFRTWINGYQNSETLFTPTAYAYGKTVYIYPNIGTPETPENIDVTIRTMDSSGYSAISGAIVTIQNILTGGNTLQASTNATGYVTFYDFPNSAYIGGHITKSGYVYQNWNLPYNVDTGSFMPNGDIVYTVQLTPSSSVTPTGTIVVPTPTPVSIDKLMLTATPDSINLGSSVSLTGSSSNVTRLTYAGGLRRTSFYVNTHAQTYPVDFNMIGVFENVNATYWKFRADNTASWNEPTTASPLTLVNIPKVNGLLTYAFNAYDTNGAIATAGIDEVLVGGGAGSGALTISVGAYDATTTGRLMDFSLNITDEGSGVVTEYGNINYMKEITLPRGNGYVLRTTKEGYQTSTTIGESGTRLIVVPTSLSIQKGDYGAVFNVPMFPDGAITIGNTSISVRVFDIETYYPLSGVQVTNSYAPTDIKYTGEEDSLTWIMPQNTAYTLTAFKSGYCTITQSKNTSTNTHQFVPLYLKYGSCSGATATPTSTPTITPTATPIGGWGNITGGATVCGVMPEDATIIDILKNSMACNGLEDTQSQNLGMSMLIILFAAIILGRIAKGVGVLAGAIVGTVISTVAGFLPFWIIIVVIIMAGLVFAGKVFWSNSQ